MCCVQQLETELKKLQGFIEDGKVAYDEQLNNIFLSKIKIEMLIYEVRILYSDLIIESYLSVF